MKFSSLRSYLTDQDIFHYFQCPHWPYWERFGDPKDRRPLSAEEEERMTEGLERKRELVKKYYGSFREVRSRDPKRGYQRTLELMRVGTNVIYQGWLVDGEWAGRPDVLERVTGKSRWGNWYYLPVEIKRAHELHKERMAQLTFYAVLLERIQQRFPAHPVLMNADLERLTFEASNFLSEFNVLVGQLERICAGERPEPVYRKSCEDTSPWGRACFRLAKQHDDIALLFNVDVSKLRALREHGIRTVEDAAALDPAALEGQAPGFTLRALQSIQRQAIALHDERVIIKRAWKHETKGLEIHFDIESHPPTDTDYLYGFLLQDETGGCYQAFVAEKPAHEKKMWQAFLAWLPTLPAEYTVYHYASYEAERLKILARRYGDEDNLLLQRFQKRLVDLKEKTREHAVFPLYFYSLKNICKSLGFHWTGELQSGAASIGVYERWLKTRRRAVLGSLLRYNEDDVRATAFLLHWLNAYTREEQSYQKPYPWNGQVRKNLHQKNAP